MARLDPKTFLGQAQKSWASEDLYLDLSFYKEDSAFPRHEHTNPYFSFVLDGSCLETSCLGQTELSDCSVVFHASGSRHSNYWRQSGRCMSLELLPCFWSKFGQDPSTQPASRLLNRGAADLARKLYNEVVSPDSASNLVIEASALLLVAELVRQPSMDETTPRWLRRAKELLREEFIDPPRLTELANQVGVHPTHLARCFQNCYGLSVGDYVRAVRVEKACGLLMGTKQGVGEIGIALGFSDQSHFSRTFKMQTGFTPRQFRQIQARNVG